MVIKDRPDKTSFRLSVTNKLNCHLSTSEKTVLLANSFSRPDGVISYGSGWGKDVNQCLEFGPVCSQSVTACDTFSSVIASFAEERKH